MYKSSIIKKQKLEAQEATVKTQEVV
jgi:hypothetical protein